MAKVKSGHIAANGASLRRRAEEQLQVSATKPHLPATMAETQRLVHELQVNQIELGLQNEELRQAGEDREALLEKYSDLYDFAPVGYFTLDRSGIIKHTNLAAARLLGKESSQLIGLRLGAFVLENARQRFADFLETVFLSPLKESCQVPIISWDITPRFLQLEAVVRESVQECRVAAIDITRRRCAEAALAEKQLELEELNRSLEVRIARALEDLRKQDQMMILQERFAVMGEMINNIAHQWRQPLNTLALAVQQLPMCYDSPVFTRDFLEQKAAMAMKLIEHMSHTIDDFRNFFSSGKEKKTFDVNEVIRQTLALIEPSLHEQQIKIDFHPEGHPMISGFTSEYSQVLLNILLNARDALLDNKIANALITIRAFSKDTASVVTISDNAGGVATNIIDRLFDPYFTTRGPDRGTGIGLFMSKTIIETNMAGRLTVRNDAGGAEFRIEVKNAET